MPIHRLTVPTPFPVGPVNAYVLEGDPLTLVDPGPDYPPAREALAKGLRDIGHALADFEVVFITHPHIDHYGLASEVASASGATVMAHADAVPRMRGLLHRGNPQEPEALAALFARAGVPAEFMGGLAKQWAAAERLGSAVEVGRVLADGDLARAGGVTWRVLSTPGHSPGSVCFYDPASRDLIAGDTLLSEITSNAILEFREEGAPAGAARGTLVRERTLPIYLDTLRRVADLDVDEVLPGHGEPFTGHRAIVAERMKHYEARKAAISAILRDRGPSTVSTIARTLFPDQTEPTGQFLALSEVLGHLDLLEADGAVLIDRSGDADLYRLAGAAPA